MTRNIPWVTRSQLNRAPAARPYIDVSWSLFSLSVGELIVLVVLVVITISGTTAMSLVGTNGTFSSDWLFLGGLFLSREEKLWLELFWSVAAVLALWSGLEHSSARGLVPWWLRELRMLCKLWKLWILRFSSRSSNVLLNARTTRSCQTKSRSY